MKQKMPLPGLPHLNPGSIYCIGRNYAEHAKELNNPIPESPVIFTKPLAALTFDGIVRIPSMVKEPHFEAEVVMVIGKQGKQIAIEDVYDHVGGYGIGVDITARDIQQNLKKKGQPWFLAKGLDTFAPVSPFIDSDRVTDPENLSFSLDINGKRRQTGNTSQMLFSIPDILVTLSRYVTLYPGDLIFTGTPEGVGLLNDGDQLKADLESGLTTLQATVKREN